MYNRILLNAYLVNNLGDDLFIKIICERYRDIIFYIIESVPYTNCFKFFPNVKVCPYEEICTLKFDLQILIGGSLFMQPQNILEINTKFKSVENLRISPKIPFIIIGANFGPYTEITHFNIYNNWFKKIDDVCFRDIQSYELFEFLPNIRWAPDVIFNYKIGKINRSKSVSISCIYNNQRIGLNNYPQSNYFQQLASIAVYYIDNGYEINFASFCKHQDDSIAIKEIMKYIPEIYYSRIFVTEYNGMNLNDFLSKFLMAEYIIGTRFHSIILAWLANIPVFPIVYNIKTNNVIQSYGFQGNYINIEDIDKCSLNFIDENRKKDYCLNCEQLISLANKQFYFLDKHYQQ